MKTIAQIKSFLNSATMEQKPHFILAKVDPNYMPLFAKLRMEREIRPSSFLAFIGPLKVLAKTISGIFQCPYQVVACSIQMVCFST